jgi:hypothetical protein
MLEHMKNEFNKTVTENGDKAFKSTKSDVLDFFSRGGAMRERSDADIIKTFGKAFAEDNVLALKALFYFRDIRKGQGERRLFRTILKYMAENHSDKIRNVIKHIPEYGRYDDLYILFGTPLEMDTLDFIKTKFTEDAITLVTTGETSLIFKWMPSENASSKITKGYAKKIRKYLNVSSKGYRKILSEGRRVLNLVETSLSNKECSGIDYGKIPSRAGIVYRKAFYRNDEARYTKFLDAVEKGEVTVNAGTLYPYELYDMARNVNDRTADAMWKNLPNYVKEDENAIVMADVSGSMSGRPMSVSVSLGMYFAERNKGVFANHFMSFSESPQLIEIKGSNLHEKINFMEGSKWGYNTDLMKAFEQILNVGVANKVPQSEFPKTMYIISDMQFDEATDSRRGWGNTPVAKPTKSTFEKAKERFNLAGYELPNVVFWNVNARLDNSPITMNQYGVQLVSGFSPTLFSQIVGGLTPYEQMMEILSSDRYKDIE